MEIQCVSKKNRGFFLIQKHLIVVSNNQSMKKAPYALLHTSASSVNQKTTLVYSESAFFIV